MKGDDCLSEYILEMKDISKGFAGGKALDHVQLQVKSGEVHASLRKYQMGDDSHLYKDATEKVVVKSYI
ncbi:hypothetical protein DXB15_03550 [Roseburia sp. OM02-15]|nr:hypothetical protein DXB15_03550 [Roseburia sp. OM02-15]